MSTSIGGLAVPIGVDTSMLTAGISQASSQVAGFANGLSNRVAGIAGAMAPAASAMQAFTGSFAAGNMIAGISGVSSALSGVIGQTPGLSSLASAWNAVTGPVGLVSAAIAGVYYAGTKALSSIEKNVYQLARAWGTTAEKAQEFEYALATFGKTTDDVSTVFDKMRAKVGDLTAGDEAATKAFHRLGLSAQDLQGLGVPETFRLISDRLSKQTDSSTRASMAMDIFGKSWASVEGLMFRGGAQFAFATEQARRFGLVLSTDQVASIKKIVDETKRVGAAWGSIGTYAKNQIALMMAPVIEAVSPVLMQIREAIQPILNSVGAAMRTIGGFVGNIANQASGILAPFVAIGKLAFEGFGVSVSNMAAGMNSLVSIATTLYSKVSDLLKFGDALKAVESVTGKGSTDSVVSSGIGIASGGPFAAVADAWAKLSKAWKEFGTTSATAAAAAAAAAMPATNSPKVLEDIGKEVAKLEEEMNALGLTTEEALIKKFQNAGASGGALHLLKAMQEQMKEMKMQQAVKDATKSIDEMTAAIGKDAQEIQRMKLVAMGATDELKKFDAAVKEFKEKTAEKAAGDFLGDLEKQIATFGMDAIDIKIIDLKDMGVAPEIIKKIEDAAKTLANLKKEAKADADWEAFWDTFDEAGRALADSVRGPLDQFEQQLSDIRMQFEMGNLSADQYALAIKKAVDQVDKLNEANASPTVALKGSSAAYSAILAANRQGERNNEKPEDRVARIVEQQRRLQEQQLAEARALRTALDNSPVIRAGGGF